MCYLVTIGIRESIGRVEAMLGDGQLLAVKASQNASLRSVFPREDRLFELTSGPCSCDLIIPSSQRSAEQQRARRQAQYQRKGWSQAKIARALADWESAHARQVVAWTASGMQFYALLRALATKPGGLRVFIHFYSGEFDNEEVEPGGRVRVPAGELTGEGVIPEDTLAEITATAG